MLEPTIPASYTPPPPATTSYAIAWERSAWVDMFLLRESYEYTYVTYLTTIIPLPADPSALPRQVVHTGISEYHTTGRTTFADRCPTTEYGAGTVHTGRTTLSYVRSGATHLPASVTRVEDLPCRGDEGVNAPDPVCEGLGLDTACLGQCRVDGEGVFECRGMLWPYDTPEEGYWGRVCWGGEKNASIHQLATPCLAGDHWMGCEPGKGWNDGYRAIKWV